MMKKNAFRRKKRKMIESEMMGTKETRLKFHGGWVERWVTPIDTHPLRQPVPPKFFSLPSYTWTLPLW